MSNTRQPLPLDDLSEFQPRQKARPTERIRKDIEKVSSFPSRESSREGQINIKTSEDILDRFRAMAKEHRYRHGEFLAVLMDAFDKSGR